MTFKTNEKKITLYLLAIIDKIMSCNGCFICGMPKSKNGQSLLFAEK